MKTAIEYFYDWEKDSTQRIFLRQPYGSTWKTLTYAEAGNEARRIAAALHTLGLRPGDHIGIFSKNCYHWILADLAIMMGGFVSVPFYASLPGDQIAEVVNKGDVKLLFVGKLDKWDDHPHKIPSDIKIIRFPHYEGNALVSEGLDWDQLVNNHQPIDTFFIPQLDDVWSILFTSGTTGGPKGVILTHRSPAIVIHDEVKNNELGITKLSEVQLLSFLPLNHVGERIGIEMLCLLMGGTMSFVESLNTFAQNLYDTQPTFFFAVPRLWAKMQKGIFEKIPENIINLLFTIPVISYFIKKVLRKKLGFGKLQITLTGAAITPSYLKKWFMKLGINLREVYGMTEGCGSVTLTPIGEFSPDNVGKPLKGFEVKIDPNTGEVLYRSAQQMVGYYKEPQKTAQVIKDGWIYSGDKGLFDKDGNLRIIGRISDTFKTAKGKFIDPAPIEEELSKNVMIDQVCVVGLGLMQPVALINLSEIASTFEKTKLDAELHHALEIVNSNLINFEKLAKIVVTKELWSDQNQLLTPTLKIRRSRLLEKYGEKLHHWYDQNHKVVWEM